jgi:hypothetical protein
MRTIIGAAVGTALLVACGSPESLDHEAASATLPAVSMGQTDSAEPGSSTPPAAIEVDLNADIGIDSLVYDVEGLTRDQRGGEPRPSPEVRKLLAPIRDAYGGVAIGDEFDLELVIEEETYSSFEFLPVVRYIDEVTYLIGWVDQTTFGASPDGALDKVSIEFVYDDAGQAIGSMPFPEPLPASYPLPEHLDRLLERTP